MEKNYKKSALIKFLIALGLILISFFIGQLRANAQTFASSVVTAVGFCNVSGNAVIPTLQTSNCSSLAGSANFPNPATGVAVKIYRLFNVELTPVDRWNVGSTYIISFNVNSSNRAQPPNIGTANWGLTVGHGVVTDYNIVPTGENSFRVQAIYHRTDGDRTRNPVTFTISNRWSVTANTLYHGESGLVPFSVLMQSSNFGQQGNSNFTANVASTTILEVGTDGSVIVSAINSQGQMQLNAINTQTNAINNQTTVITQQTDEIRRGNDFLMDMTAPNVDVGQLSGATGWLPPGPLDSILNLPFTLMSVMISSLGGTCSPVTIPLPFVGQSLNIPCFTSVLDTNWTTFTHLFVGVIPSAFIFYAYFKRLYKKVSKATSMASTSEDQWGAT